MRRRRWQCVGTVGNALATLAVRRRRWQCVGDARNASAMLAMRRRRWQCVGDVGNASATLAMRRRRWQYVGDVGNTVGEVCSQYVCEVGSQYNTSARLGVNTLLTLVMRRRRS